MSKQIQKQLFDGYIHPVDDFKTREQIQIHKIKRYQKIQRFPNFDEAFFAWCQSGLAQTFCQFYPQKNT